jgi:tripartite-type tricarboxylate transporter receptor subunit TctC
MTNKFQIDSGSRRRTLALAACLVAGTALSTGAWAQGSTAPVLRFVVPFAAGSYTDNIARIVAPGIGQRLGQTVVIENKPGANGVIGADFVAKAAPDGQTILVGGASVNTVNPSLYKSLPYDPVKDLLPVARIGERHHVAARLGVVVPGQMRPLAGEILVQEQDFHGQS